MVIILSMMFSDTMGHEKKNELFIRVPKGRGEFHLHKSL
jgi:hypothetical protein